MSGALQENNEKTERKPFARRSAGATGLAFFTERDMIFFISMKDSSADCEYMDEAERK